jgi:hypothetical protein
MTRTAAPRGSASTMAARPPPRSTATATSAGLGLDARNVSLSPTTTTLEATPCGQRGPNMPYLCLRFGDEER